MRNPKVIKFMVTMSVLLNVLLLGTLGGMAYKKYADHQERREIKESLTPEARHLMARTMQQNRSEIRAIMQESKRLQEDLVEVMSAEEFDEAAFDKAIEKLKDAQERVAGVKIEATRKLAQELSAEERKRLSKRLSNIFEKRRSSGYKGPHQRPNRFYGDKESKPD
jgi:uncharacterized membrane protein